MKHLQELLSAKETALFLGISRTTLWRKTQDGSLPSPLCVAGLKRWRKSELCAFLDNAGSARSEVSS